MPTKNEQAFRIIHVSTLHRRDDVRIFHKEAKALANKLDAEVLFCVQDGLPDDGGATAVVSAGNRIKSLPLRVTVGQLRMYRLVSRLKPTVVHIHDPELIPLGLAFKLRGTAVVQDVHEEYRKIAIEKSGRSTLSRRILHTSVVSLETLSDIAFDAIICATEVIARNFRNKNTVVVKNYPDVGEFYSQQRISAGAPKNVSYIGNITGIRGVIEMVNAIGLVADPHAKLSLAGAFASPTLRATAESLNGWSRVEYHGWADRNKVSDILTQSCAGLVILHPHGNYVESLPTKMFEYMAAGLPVIVSNFQVFKEIIAKYDCGIAVDPLSSGEIANAIDWVLSHPDKAREMGRRGRAAVEDELNWASESEKLIVAYRKIFAAVRM